MTAIPVLGAASGDLAGNFPGPRLAHYRTIIRGATRGQASVITGAGTYFLSLHANTVQPVNNGNATMMPFYLQPTDWTATGLSTKLRLLVGCLVTDVAPAITFTVGLYPVTAWAGGTTITNPTVGSVVSGSTVPFVSPAANSMTAETSSGDFNFPSAGYYIAALVASGAAATNSNPTFTWALQVRNV